MMLSISNDIIVGTMRESTRLAGGLGASGLRVLL